MPCDPPGCVGSASRGSRLSASTWCMIACTDAPACFSHQLGDRDSRGEKAATRNMMGRRRVAACGVDDDVDFSVVYAS